MFPFSAFMAFPSHVSLRSSFFSPPLPPPTPPLLLLCGLNPFIYLEFILIKDPASQELFCFPLI